MVDGDREALADSLREWLSAPGAMPAVGRVALEPLPELGEIALMDARGMRVRGLQDGEMEPGKYAVMWDGRDDAGEEVGSGVYFYMVRIGDFSKVYKLVQGWR